MGAEDFAEFGRTKEKVPLCLFWLGTQDPATVADGLKMISAPLRPRHRAPSGKCRS